MTTRRALRILASLLVAAACLPLAARAQGGPIAHWSFDEGAGTTAADSSGNGHNGTLQNGPTWVPGIINGALHFDAVDDNVKVLPTGLTPDSQMSVALWVRMEQSRSTELCDLMRKAADGQVGWVLRWSHRDGRLQYRIDRNSSGDVYVVDSQPNSAYLNGWHHIAATYDGIAGTGILYVDGKEHARVSGVPGTLEHSGDLYIGRFPFSDHVSPTGSMDDIRLYDRALTPPEVVALAGMGPPVAAPDNYLVQPDTPLAVPSVGVLANDRDAGLAALSAVKDSDPAHGSLTLNADGSFLYTPAPGYTGSDSFTYHAVADGQSSETVAVNLYVGADVSAGLVGRWTFDEGAGTAAADSSGNGNDGTLANGTMWGEGVSGGCALFDMDNDNIKVPQHASLEPANGVTVAVWARMALPRSNTYCDLVRKAAAVGYLLRWSHNDGKVQWRIDRNASVDLAAVDTQSNEAYLYSWRHFTGTYDSATGEAILYVDGKERARAAGAPDLLEHSDDLYFSDVRSPNSSAEGALDDVRVYDRALSAAEVLALAQRAPLAVADGYGVAQGGTLDVPIASGVLANDHDPNGQALVAILEGAPPAGLVFRGDGSFTYTPPAETAGLATFSYRASDGNLLSDPVAVAIRIDAPPMTVTSFTAGPAQVAAEFSKPLHAASAGPGSVLVTGAGPDQVFDTPDDLAAQGSIQLLDGNRIQFTPQAGTLPDDRYRIRFRSTGALAASAPQSNAGADGVDLRAVSPVLGGASGLLSLTLSGQGFPIFDGATRTFHTATFDGVDDNFLIPDADDLDVPAITIEAWVGPLNENNGSEGWVFAKRSNAPFQWNKFHLVSGVGARFHTVPGGGTPLYDLDASDKHPLGSWKHIAATFQPQPGGGIKRLYINGILQGEEAYPHGLAPSNYSLNLGRFQGWDWAGYYKGQMAEVRYWKVARTQAQLKAAMFAPVSDPDLILRYDFDEAGPNATDRTGNGHTAQGGGGVAFGGSFELAPVMVRLVNGSNEAFCGGPIACDGSSLACQVDVSALPAGLYDVEVLEGRSRLLARLPRGVAVLSSGGVTAADGGVLDGEYVAALPSGDGTPGGDFVAEFTVNEQAPFVTGTVPADDAAGVNQGVDIAISFSEAMNRASAEAAVSIAPPAAYAPVWNGNTLVLRIDEALAELTAYTVTVGAGAQDLGGAPMAAPYSFEFTTGQVTVTGIDPSSSYPGPTLKDVRIDGTGFFQGTATTLPEGVSFYKGNAYLHVEATVSWYDAKAACEAMGGHLVTIADAEENAFVRSLAGYVFWIGLTDQETEGTWKWITGEPVNYTNWRSGEPNNSGNEDHANIEADGRWNDLQGDRSTALQPYMCEWEAPFPPGVKLKLGAAEILPQRTQFVSETELRADFNLAGAAPGAYDVVVSNPDGGGAGTLSGGFEILEPPQLLSIQPPAADRNATVGFTVGGIGLPTWTGTAQGSPNYSAYGIRITNGTNTVYAAGALESTPSTLTCTVNLSGLPLGLYNIVLLSGSSPLATLAQGLRIVDPELTVTDLAGNVLDGEFPGTLGDVQPDGLPSGNGTAGGDFVGFFDLDTPRMQVAAFSPAPGSILTAGPPEILAAFAKPLDPASVTVDSFELLRRGPDGAWDTADDQKIAPAAVQFPGPNQAKLDLAGVGLVNDEYRVRLKSSSPPGKALRLDGGNDYVTIPDAPALQLTEAVTAEAWFRFQSGGTQNPRVVSEKSVFPEITTVGTGSSRRIDTTINLQGVGIVRVQGTTQLAANVWHHAAVTYDRSALKLYLNGQLEGQTAATAAIFVTGNPHILGRQQGTSLDNYRGDLDEVRFWNRARTQSEIQADMRRTLNGGEFGLVGYWRFDGTGQTVTDFSGNGLHGYLGGSASAASDDPLRVASSAPLDGGVRDAHANALDGEYPGAGGDFPSGDGSAGGDFVASFVIESPIPNLAALSFTPGILSIGPDEILATFTQALDPATVTADHAHLLSAGDDGAFGTGDDVQLVPAGVSLEEGNQVRLNLTNVTWSSNFYRLRFVSGGLRDLVGNPLDGEYPGPGGASLPLPSGDGAAGGDAIVGFRINLPPAPAGDGYSVDEDATLNAASVLNNDSDLHGGDPGENNLPLTAELASGPAHAASFAFNPDGTFAYTPAEHYNGADGFTYRAKDALGLASAPVAVALTVNSINDAPAAASDAYELDEDTTLDAASVLSNDSDLHGGAPGENNTPLTAALAEGPSHAAAFTFNADGTFSYTPAANYHGPDGFTYRASDALSGLSAVTSVALTVNSVNDPPATAADAYDLDEDTTLDAASVLNNDSDLHGGAPGENNTPLTAALFAGPAHAASFSLEADGTFSYTPVADFFGVDGFTYRAVDAAGGVSAATTVTLTIDPVDDEPTLSVSAGVSLPVQADPGDMLDFTAEASDGDPGETFTYLWDFGDGETSTEQNPEHMYAEAGLYQVIATVTDSQGHQGTANLFVAVSGILKYTELKVDQAAYALNFAAQARSGPEVDTLSVRGRLNVQGLVEAGLNPEDLAGQPLTLEFGGVAATLAAPARVSSSSVQWQSPRGAKPNLRASFSPKTGAFSVSVSQIDYATALAAYGAADGGGISNRLVTLPLELRIGAWTGIAVLGTRYSQARANTTGRGAFRLAGSGYELPGGLFIVERAQVTQVNQRGVLKQRVTATLTFLPMAGTTYDPTQAPLGAEIGLGDFGETAGDGTVGGALFTTRNGDLYLYTRPRTDANRQPLEATGVANVRLTKSKGSCSIVTNWIEAGAGEGIFGIAPVLDSRGDPRASATLEVRLDFGGVGGRQTVRLLRVGTAWKR
ncbi:MAG: tandem-95 repeat protein [Planctomycetota bacterium]|nr:tandem-95 repeat protein [Planctomycetota bacterium]